MKPLLSKLAIHFFSAAVIGLAITLPLSAWADESTKPASRIGRPVRIASFSFSPGKPPEKILQLVDEEGAKGTDLIVLPETWRGQNDQSMESLEGPTIKALE